jgi:hypothetical protein
MIERVIYTAEAEQDVTDAYSWYEAREPGLGVLLHLVCFRVVGHTWNSIHPPSTVLV